MLPVPGPRQARQIRTAKQHGTLQPLTAWQEARLAGLEYATALALLDQESGGGHNEFGHDPTIYIGAGTVTKTKYQGYKAARVRSGNRMMQGVGPCQLTWWSTQDHADLLGGCWKPRYNMRQGFRALAGNIARYGFHAGVRAYNGSGPAAERYAENMTERRAEWLRRLA